MRALRYAFDEAVASLWRGRGSGAFSAATIALALFVLGAFLIVTSNLERLGSEWSSSADMSVYLNDAVTAAERTAIEGVLETGDLVLARAYVSKADALARFRSTFADLASSMEGRGTTRCRLPTRCGCGPEPTPPWTRSWRGSGSFRGSPTCDTTVSGCPGWLGGERHPGLDSPWASSWRWPPR
jgi:hypothetical protein